MTPTSIGLLTTHSTITTSWITVNKCICPGMVRAQQIFGTMVIFLVETIEATMLRLMIVVASIKMNLRVME